MSALLGVHDRRRRLQEGAFHCPDCGQRRRYDLLRTAGYFHVLGIPLWQQGAERLEVQCRRCGRVFTEDVLLDGEPEPELSADQEAFLGGQRGPAPGDRVLGRWDFFWYPGTVDAVDEEGVRVLFDDGDDGVLPPDRVLPLLLKTGEPVFARKEGGNAYSPARITRIRGKVVYLRYDDGKQEISKLSRLRVLRGETPCPWKKGDRVLALWPAEPFLYAATVVRVDQGFLVEVHYDDGDRAVLTPDVMEPLEIRIGRLVFARSERDPRYLPGEVDDLRGDKLFVRFERGAGQWVPIRMARFLPPMLEEHYRANPPELG